MCENIYSLLEYCIGDGPLSEVYMIRTARRKMYPLPHMLALYIRLHLVWQYIHFEKHCVSY
jgi:hypothetical protein